MKRLVTVLLMTIGWLLANQNYAQAQMAKTDTARYYHNNFTGGMDYTNHHTDFGSDNDVGWSVNTYLQYMYSGKKVLKFSKDLVYRLGFRFDYITGGTDFHHVFSDQDILTAKINEDIWRIGAVLEIADKKNALAYDRLMFGYEHKKFSQTLPRLNLDQRNGEKELPLLFVENELNIHLFQGKSALINQLILTTGATFDIPSFLGKSHDSPDPNWTSDNLVAREADFASLYLYGQAEWCLLRLYANKSHNLIVPFSLVGLINSWDHKFGTSYLGLKLTIIGGKEEIFSICYYFKLRGGLNIDGSSNRLAINARVFTLAETLLRSKK